MASTAFARERIDLDHPATWPKAVCAFLAEHHELFLRWETTQGGVSPPPLPAKIDETLHPAEISVEGGEVSGS